MELKNVQVNHYYVIRTLNVHYEFEYYPIKVTDIDEDGFDCVILYHNFPVKFQPRLNKTIEQPYISDSYVEFLNNREDIYCEITEDDFKHVFQQVMKNIKFRRNELTRMITRFDNGIYL